MWHWTRRSWSWVGCFADACYDKSLWPNRVVVPYGDLGHVCSVSFLISACFAEQAQTGNVVHCSRLRHSPELSAGSTRLTRASCSRSSTLFSEDSQPRLLSQGFVSALSFARKLHVVPSRIADAAYQCEVTNQTALFGRSSSWSSLIQPRRILLLCVVSTALSRCELLRVVSASTSPRVHARTTTCWQLSVGVRRFARVKCVSCRARASRVPSRLVIVVTLWQACCLNSDASLLELLFRFLRSGVSQQREGFVSGTPRRSASPSVPLLSALCCTDVALVPAVWQAQANPTEASPSSCPPLLRVVVPKVAAHANYAASKNQVCTLCGGTLRAARRVPSVYRSSVFSQRFAQQNKDHVLRSNVSSTFKVSTYVLSCWCCAGWVDTLISVAVVSWVMQWSCAAAALKTSNLPTCLGNFRTSSASCYWRSWSPTWSCLKIHSTFGLHKLDSCRFVQVADEVWQGLVKYVSSW